MSDEKSTTQANAEEWMRSHPPDQWQGNDENPNASYRPNGWEKFEENTFDGSKK